MERDEPQNKKHKNGPVLKFDCTICSPNSDDADDDEDETMMIMMMIREVR